MKMIDGTKSTQHQLSVSGHIMLRREVTSDHDTELTLEMLPVSAQSLRCNDSLLTGA